MMSALPARPGREAQGGPLVIRRARPATCMTTSTRHVTFFHMNVSVVQVGLLENLKLGMRTGTIARSPIELAPLTRGGGFLWIV